jgi:hypothetical protein
VLAAQVLNLAILIGFCVWRLNMPLCLFNAFHGDTSTQFASVTVSFLRRFEYRKTGRDSDSSVQSL